MMKLVTVIFILKLLNMSLATPLAPAVEQDSDALTLKKCLNGKTLLLKDSTGATTFFRKAQGGDIECVESILQEGRRTNQLKKLIDKADDYGRTPLYTASFNGRTAIVKFLLKNGANVNTASNEKDTQSEGSSPLIASCSNGHEEIASALLSHGGDVNHQRKNGADCVYRAAQENQLGILKLILPNNPHLLNRHLYEGFTITHTAAWHGHYDVLQYILQASNTSINDKSNYWDETPLGLATRFDGDLRMVQLLIAHGANPRLISDGKTPQQWAKQKGKIEIENYLKTL